MLTIFSTPKPFKGHIGVIQRNALESWKRVDSGVEIILFGDEEGAAETALSLGIRHVPDVKRNEHGAKYLPSIFDQAQRIARHSIICYINCDIVLTSDFCEALAQVSARFSHFLMVGQRWDTDVTEPIDFSDGQWASRLRDRARAANHQRPPNWIDYFAFSRGLYLGNTPPFVIGRPGWDNWLLWKARASGAAVVDVSTVVLAIHQNHDYAYHPDGEAGVWQGEEAQRNYALLEEGRCFRTMENATHLLTSTGFQRNLRHWTILARRKGHALASSSWFALLDWTRPLRDRLGLRRQWKPR